MLGCSLVQPSSFWDLSVTSEIINVTGTAIFTCQAQSHHLETEACSSRNEHLGGQGSGEGKLVGCIYFLGINEMSITETRSQMFTSILVIGEQKWLGVEGVGHTCGLRKKTPWDTEAPRMSDPIGDFLELPFISNVFRHDGSIYFRVGSDDAVLRKDMEYPFNFQSKKNVHASMRMWFVGFMVKDPTAGIVSKPSFKILFCAPDICEDWWS